MGQIILAKKGGEIMEEFIKVSNGIFSVNVDVDLKAAFSASFTGKDGNEIPYFRGCIIGKRGLTEVSITKALFDEIDGHLPAVISCTAVCNLAYGKIHLTTLQ